MIFSEPCEQPVRISENSAGLFEVYAYGKFTGRFLRIEHALDEFEFLHEGMTGEENAESGDL